MLGSMIESYLKTGKTGYGDSADEVVEQYLDTGTTGDDAADKKINTYLTKLIKNYNATGTTGLSEVNKVIEKYRKTKDSGYDAINDLLRKNLDLKLIMDPEAKPNSGTTKPNTGTGTGTGGGGGAGGGGGQAQDTRIFFTAVLMYRENLIDAELSRKGLDQNAKVEKLEVAEK
jgi:hypothetical protein